MFRERHAKGNPHDLLEASHEEIVSTFSQLEGKCENLISFLEKWMHGYEVTAYITYPLIRYWGRMGIDIPKSILAAIVWTTEVARSNFNRKGGQLQRYGLQWMDS